MTFDEELGAATGGKKIVGEWLEHNVDMSIDGSLDKVWQGIVNYARKSGSNCVAIPDDEVYKMAAELWADPKTADIKVSEPALSPETPVKKKEKKAIENGPKKDKQISFTF